MTDWAPIVAGQGVIGPFALEDLDGLRDAVAVAVRDGFEINDVPLQVVEAMKIARDACSNAHHAVVGLAEVMVAAYAARGLDPSGQRPRVKTPAELEEEAERERAEDVRKRSTHRPDR